MNRWFNDPRARQAEVDAFKAERAERRGDLHTASSLYHRAGEDFAAVAISVPADHPNTRSHLAIAAVVSYSRAGDFRKAVEFGQRLLAEGDALSDYGRGELLRLVGEYRRVVAAFNKPTDSHITQSSNVREDVRISFTRRAA